MKACIITTTRKAETNLGDTLIADRCGDLARSLGENVSVKNLFHRATWEDAQKTVESSDVVLVACLAIRKGMFNKNYSFMKELLASSVPLCVISAGISLSAFSAMEPVASQLTEEEIEALKAISERSAFFSSRGYLTQAVLAEVGIPSVFAGDVAFYEPRFSDRKFQPLETVSRIAVSDLHYPESYRDSFLYLIKKLQSLFPKAQIDILVHGINEPFMPIAEAAGVHVVKLYEEHGLDQYDNYDLHVGYRVHGHVSALARRIPSYLLEQDDRGTDYGASFSRRITVASHRNISRQSQVLPFPIDTLAAILRQDVDQGFSRFFGLESEVEACGARNLEGVRTALAIKSSA